MRKDKIKGFLSREKGKYRFEPKDREIKLLRRRLIIPKVFFMILFATLFIILTKVKLTPIFGTDTAFSASVFFGPSLGGLLGIGFGSFSIIIGHVIGLLIGFYKIKSLLSMLVFVPILFGGIYFARMFKGDKRLVLVPGACMAMFLLHPIGRDVWFYSLYWLIPILIARFRERIEGFFEAYISLDRLRYVARIYSYGFGTAMVDHSVGSVIYLYLLNIPAHFWIMAIPFTIVERIIIGGGIAFSYIAVKKVMEILQQAAVAMKVLQRQKESLEEPIRV